MIHNMSLFRGMTWWEYLVEILTEAFIHAITIVKKGIDAVRNATNFKRKNNEY